MLLQEENEQPATAAHAYCEVGHSRGKNIIRIS